MRNLLCKVLSMVSFHDRSKWALVSIQFDRTRTMFRKSFSRLKENMKVSTIYKEIITIALVMVFAITGCGYTPVTETVRKPANSTEDLSPLFTTDYRAGLQRARDENKPLLVYFMAKNCVFSRQMTRETLSDPTFRDFAQNFVCVQIDISEPSSEKLCEDLQIKGTPTIQFMSPSGVPLQRLTQPQPAKELVLQMQSVLYSLAWKEDKYYR